VQGADQATAAPVRRVREREGGGLQRRRGGRRVQSRRCHHLGPPKVEAGVRVYDFSREGAFGPHRSTYRIRLPMLCGDVRASYATDDFGLI
jgi:hypothetical protein